MFPSSQTFIPTAKKSCIQTSTNFQGKAVPLQARCGPEGSRKFRRPDFHDIRHMKLVRLSTSHTGRLYPQEIFLVLIFTRGWVDTRSKVRLEGICHWKTQWHHQESIPGTVRLVAQRLNHYATPGPNFHVWLFYNIGYISLFYMFLCLNVA